MSSRPRLPLTLSLLCLLLLCTPARGQTAAPEGPEALAVRAQAAEQKGDWQGAATLWESAYAQQQNPEYLFYLGEASAHLQGPAMTARALRAYRRYLVQEQQPRPAQRERATAAIRELVQRQAKERAEHTTGGKGEARLQPLRGVPPLPSLAEAPAPLAEQAPSEALSMTLPSQLVAVQQPPPPRPRHRRMRAVGIAMLGAGVVLGSIGGILLANSIATANQSRQADTFAMYLDGHRSALDRLTGGSICLALSGASLIGGGLMLGAWARQEAR